MRERRPSLEQAKSLVTEGYRYIAKPAATEIGKTAGVTSLVLWPVNALVVGIKLGLERLRARVAEKLECIPPERQLAAPPSLAAKIALNYALLDDGDEVSELRGLFEDLLCAMDRSAPPRLELRHRLGRRRSPRHDTDARDPSARTRATRTSMLAHSVATIELVGRERRC